ncbi:hypothetical protein [Streptomyces yunnanensis]|uniref:Uncharacterized protein n=1 Tax=Streptomyces yunnanensis TaxID=156453 RepID=A0A9X8N5J8_9ACTN|nr:hypothetical protein [Streptomyces yunnanensis]SHN07423.1 hypothetical protein SAMN05216268_11918 [Streptomyces yunnanensis]
MKSLGVLAAAVHVLDPVERIPVVLFAGEQVTDPAVAEQITNPRCWEGGQLPPSQELAPSKSARKAKPA